MNYNIIIDNIDSPVESSENHAYMANIQRFTIHDGPGIRTELFLKGCPLRCEWCSNPECYERFPQVGVFAKKCIGVEKCGYCLKVCAKQDRKALEVVDGKIIRINRDVCDNCLLCEQECTSGNLTLWGKKMTVEDAMEVVRRDRAFYDRSGGGVTLSGGEPLLQWRFCKDLLKLCKAEGINTCLESALHVNPKILDEVAPYIDLFITDIKQMDSGIHKKFTGVGNELILSNIKKLVDMEMPLIIRMPIIPGFNDNTEHIDNASDFILNNLNNKPKLIQMLRYRPLGEEKAKTLGLPELMMNTEVDREEFEKLIIGFVKRMNDKGIPAIAGTSEKKESQ
ncbi:glycyl-radical enzyme activating protein [Acetobacterium carbinolicum]|uniref:glycyl-radical enzyme activating protein n=1 Tax=Acetobacterium carbinolicum TaxID=52690 RepID=UPI0039BFF1F7